MTRRLARRGAGAAFGLFGLLLFQPAGLPAETAVEPSPESAAAVQPEAGQAGDPGAAQAALPLAPPQGPAVMIPQEILAMLDQRKKALDKREEEVRMKEMRLSALKTEIEGILARHQESLKLAEKLRKDSAEDKAVLDQKQAQVDADTRKADQARLAKIYESMPAEEAAARIEKMPSNRALELLRLLKGKTAGAILAQVPPTKAAKLTEQLIPKP